ncbi:MAG: mechanosensitive ion channel family protein [ANME-2 cluster archaeon]|jgi:small-conductance mechanosensitive channel|nr:mechanosensitive ion channel family protein [ANME-2 cluster archaeon]
MELCQNGGNNIISISESIQIISGLSYDTQIKLLISILIVTILFLFRVLLLKIVWKRTEDVRIRYIWQKTSTYLISIIIIFLFGQLWFRGFGEFGTFLGLVSAGLAIALKDPITNIAGWFFIILRKPFTLKDRIQIGDHAGDVIDIRIFQFTLLEIGNWVDADQSTGRIIHIPNGIVFTEVTANYTKGFQYIWDEIPVLLTFESNWKKAKDILINISNNHAEHLSKPAEKKVKEASRKFMIFYNEFTPKVYTNVKDSGILLTIRYLCEPRSRRGTQHDIWENILDQFSQCEDIDFAYPTQRFYNNLLENKTRIKSPPDI